MEDRYRILRQAIIDSQIEYERPFLKIDIILSRSGESIESIGLTDHEARFWSVSIWEHIGLSPLPLDRELVNSIILNGEPMSSIERLETRETFRHISYERDQSVYEMLSVS